MASQEPVLVEMNFGGSSSSNKSGWRRVASDGGAQLRADPVGGKSPGTPLHGTVLAWVLHCTYSVRMYSIVLHVVCADYVRTPLHLCSSVLV